MLIKLTDIVSDGLHGLILCTFFFITEAEIDASGLDGLGKGVKINVELGVPRSN